MKFSFYKMQGAGNDFLMTDDPAAANLSSGEIASACDRRFGAGADGLIFLTKSPGEDAIRFAYFNSDGSRAEMCGNGLRCAMEFACLRGMAEDSGAKFRTDSGILSARRLAPGRIRIQMPDAAEPREIVSEGFRCFFTKVGVPHAVVEVSGLDSFDVRGKGRLLRHAEEFFPAGTNVDFVEILDSDTLRIRTYERGVEDETLACGTGITAAAVFLRGKTGGSQKKRIICRSKAELEIEFTEKRNILKGIFLTGPATVVFRGTFD